MTTTKLTVAQAMEIHEIISGRIDGLKEILNVYGNNAALTNPKWEAKLEKDVERLKEILRQLEQS